MPDFLGKLLTSEPIEPARTALALSVALLAGIILSLVYLYTHRGRRYRQSFIQTIPLLTVIAAGVTILIGDNLARAFGLIGAVAIIRFRTAIRNPRDMTYVFLVIVMGMSCGLGQFWLVGLIMLVYVTIAVAMTRLDYGGDCISRRRYRLQVDVENMSDFQTFLRENLTGSFDQIRLESVGSAKGRFRLEYRVVLRHSVKPLNFAKQIVSMNQNHFKNFRIESLD